MEEINVFLDSDVVISFLLSDSGAAHILVNLDGLTNKYISNLSLKEITAVAASCCRN